MKFHSDKIREALFRSWSSDSAAQWRSENPALGQCNVTAMVIRELFGGEILKTHLPEGAHYYNFIDGNRLDFTDSQVSTEIAYEDQGVTRAEVERGATVAEQRALKEAFLSCYDE